MSDEATETNRDFPPAPALTLEAAQAVSVWLFALADDHDLNADCFDEDAEDLAADESRAIAGAIRWAAIEFLRKAKA